jgi:hypothetical protein
MYAKVPINNGLLDIDYGVNNLQVITLSATQAIINVPDGTPTRSTWTTATETDWSNAQPLSQVKEAKIAQLQQFYYGSFTTFTSSALGTVKTYPLDLEAQGNLKDLQDRLIADSTKTTFYFKTIEDGTLMAHTRAEFLQLMQDAETYKVNQTTHYDSKVTAVNNALDIPTVQGITW